MANSEERLHSILATLEQCRAALIRDGRQETAKLVSLPILDLQTDLNHIPASDLKALCDVMTPDDEATERSNDPNSPGGPRRRAVLTLVK